MIYISRIEKNRLVKIHVMCFVTICRIMKILSLLHLIKIYFRIYKIQLIIKLKINSKYKKKMGIIKINKNLIMIFILMKKVINPRLMKNVRKNNSKNQKTIKLL